MRRRRPRRLTVEGNASRDGTETDKSTPHLVDSNLAVTSASSIGLGTLQRAPEAKGNEEHDKGGAKLAETLHGKDGSHHGTSAFGSGEPRSNSISVCLPCLQRR